MSPCCRESSFTISHLSSQLPPPSSSPEVLTGGCIKRMFSPGCDFFFYSPPPPKDPFPPFMPYSQKPETESHESRALWIDREHKQSTLNNRHPFYAKFSSHSIASIYFFFFLWGRLFGDRPSSLDFLTVDFNGVCPSLTAWESAMMTTRSGRQSEQVSLYTTAV